ncbi:MAG: Fe-S cluster assembly protein SufD [Deltaproteobacteria bacterium]|nr:MAG: Fe-S cluster assembly protein SufD [Deltaproteobacteria bacterium]
MEAPASEAQPTLQAALEGWLDRAVPGRGAPWLQRLRQAAARFLRESGLPKPKDEAWRFTPVRRITEAVWHLPRTAAPVAPPVPPHLDGLGVLRVDLVDGRFAGLDGACPEGVEVESLATMLERAPARLESLLGAVAERSPFEALNTALFEDGVFIEVAAGARIEAPIVVRHVSTGGDRLLLPRVLLHLGRGAEATVAEAWHGQGRSLVCGVSEVCLDGDAHLLHVRLQEEDPREGHEVCTLALRPGRDSRIESTVVSLGGALTRLDVQGRLLEEGAELTLDGLYYVKGAQVVDHHVVADHVAPRCTSRQRYKGIVDEAAHAVFDGVTYVRRGAQQSSGHQENRNLLLSSEAVVHTKPHLEIDADDVSASHGATVGQLEEAQLFYLLSRGIEQPTAEAILLFAFAREVLDGLPVEALRRRLEEEVLLRLPERRALEELVQ